MAKIRLLISHFKRKNVRLNLNLVIKMKLWTKVDTHICLKIVYDDSYVKDFR